MKNDIVYIENSSLDPYFNLGLEYYLTTEKTFEDNTVLLFWRTSPTLMVGKYQNTLEEINQEYAAENDIALVRRMSGGGTIYTDLGGWQYSFITKYRGEGINFKEYTQPVIEALSTIGINAEFNGRNDLVIDDRKFSGTAQYMENGFVVHHGSLLYATDIETLVKSTDIHDLKIKSKGIKSVSDRVTNISDHLHKAIGAQEFKALMVSHLIGPDGCVCKLTSADTEKIRKIAKEKFDNWESIYGKNPKCNITRKRYFEGGNIEVNLNVQKGRITDAKIYGDFFGTLKKEIVENVLIGCPYQKEDIKAALCKVEGDGEIYKITKNEILDVII